MSARAFCPQWAQVGVSALLLLAPAVQADPWRPNFNVGVTWHDNASNADRAGDQFDALETRADLALSHRIGLARNDSLHVSAQASGAWWRFAALNQSALGGRAEWQHKFGLGPLAPIVGVELSAASILANDPLRRGTSTGALVALRKRFVDVWRATLTQDFARHDARSIIHDRRGDETALAVDRPLGEAWHLAVRASYRDGDVVAHGTPPRPDLVALAPNRTPVTTFGRAMVAYSIAACSVGAEATLSRSLGPQTSARIRYGHRETKRSPLVYVNHSVSVGVAHQF